MRQNNQSVVHHVYFHPTSNNYEDAYDSFEAAHTTVTTDQGFDSKKWLTDTFRWKKSIFEQGKSDSTIVLFSAVLKSYYIFDGTGRPCKVTPHKDSKTNRYYFTHPETQQPTWAHFPEAVPTPASA